ncbi:MULTISPECIES: type II and III secretion system protein family protein [unclassified Janthinobacterium]|uniref:type II and III secretion system protein family protein n=1 Tax=unclassified Janthinobacterium TaxID=2610881 RepID=UPI001812F667|nr:MULTISPECIES: type II and III secretion system protein family protein [unclassified Janthinobacterium]MBB5370265.1 pilus assembly protein CpaC [Janthinobacterium sp. K2C7]MBB5383071.1 pilus assembly protein CpaC [Janthinobacterium sp. K2Li3]MBB5388450.1 pilus assembly protein CpaC [Janthinobacterium sp. K2E3]
MDLHMNRALLIFCLALLPQLAGAAAPLAPVGNAGLRCGGEAALPGKLHLELGKSSMLRLPEAVLQRSVGNPGVVQAILVAADTLYVVGVDVGSTNMIIQGKSGACSVVNVIVSMDPSGLQATLASLMPEEKAIRVTAVADTLVLSGTVQDAGAVLRAVELAQAYVRRATQPLALPKPADGSAPAAPAGAPQTNRVINMLDVSAPQQVMLAVQIAEVSKSLLERLEVGATLRFASGSWATTLLSNFLTGTANGLLDVRKSNGQQLTIEAQKQDGLVRILAEPTVMAISGQEGSFLAGGKIFIPVGQDNNKVTLEEREYGVGLRFTPTVLAGGRIHLKVAPEVSELSREGVGISAAGLSGRTILPVITTRRASTTVQLFDGQSYAIGGLIKNNQVSNVAGLPWLSELPILGALFRSTDFQHDRTELLFVITAHLVKPLPPDTVLPTAQLTLPSRKELMLDGKMEGPPPPVSRPAPTARAVQGFELK